MGEIVQGLGVSTRVLLVGAHPDDEDTFLIAWLSRGRHVRTAYLSLTRGDGGQNLIGNELGELLGVVRTEELFAARRVDGAVQYFTRAYDFGFSKDTTDTYAHWPKDTILGDVVRTVRVFRPHVIVGVFSGTPRDGHGQHQVSGLLAREAYELAADTVRFPTATHGPTWTPLKFYRAARLNAAGGTLSFDAGEYSPLLGQSFAEIAGESRSQHKSQGFGAPRRKGPLLGYLRREATRVNESTTPSDERSLFDGLDTSWARFRQVARDARARAALDSLPAALIAARKAFDPFAPDALLPSLARVQRLASVLDAHVDADLDESARTLRSRVQRALVLAAGVEVEALAPREVVPGRTRVIMTAYNRGRTPIRVNDRPLAPAGAVSDTSTRDVAELASPWWLRTPRAGGIFTHAGSWYAEEPPRHLLPVQIDVGQGTLPIGIEVPLEYRDVDPVKGEIRRLVASVDPVTITLDEQVRYAPAGADVDREIAVLLRSADESPRDVRVTVELPRGLTADSATRSTRLERYGDQRTLRFRVRGRLSAGDHRIVAQAVSGGRTFQQGYDLIDYDHIQRKRVSRSATSIVRTVDIRIPAGLRVAYVPGVSDNVPPMLSQLGVPVTVISPSAIAEADLRRYTSVVVGPRAYEAHTDLVAANSRLLDFARAGGTLVVQYGQYEMTQPGVMPYPITINRPHDRVTHEDAPVRIIDSNASLLRAPNRIAEVDFAQWVQERALYMPRTFDSHYRPLLEMSDPGEPLNRGAILVTPLGAGTYIYTTLSFFRQLPAGNPGAARLFVNLLSAGLASPRAQR